MSKLRRLRNRADYDPGTLFGHVLAFDQWTAATDLVRLLDEAAGMAAVRDRVTAAVRAYERDVIRDETWGG